MMKRIPIGTTVVVEAPGSRGDAGEARMVPAMVTRQWPDGALELYAFHFEGVPVMLRSVPLDRVFMVGQSEPVERMGTLIT